MKPPKHRAWEQSPWLFAKPLLGLSILWCLALLGEMKGDAPRLRQVCEGGLAYCLLFVVMLRGFGLEILRIAVKDEEMRISKGLTSPESL